MVLFYLGLLLFLGTTSNKFIDEVQKELGKQLEALPRKEIAQKALENSVMVLVTDMREAIELSNTYAPSIWSFRQKTTRRWQQRSSMPVACSWVSMPVRVLAIMPAVLITPCQRTVTLPLITASTSTVIVARRSDRARRACGPGRGIRLSHGQHRHRQAGGSPARAGL